MANLTVYELIQGVIRNANRTDPDVLSRLSTNTTALGQASDAIAAAATTVTNGLNTRAGKGANTDISSLSGVNGAGIKFTASSTSIPSAATVDLGGASTRKVSITGTTTITSFGTGAHAEVLVRFQGALTLTHNATSLVLPGAANIVTVPGDTALFTSDASGSWTCRHYQKVDGTPLVPTIGSLLSGGTGDVSGMSVLGRSLQARAQDTINIKDAPYNAKGDGVTNDGPAFNAALASGRIVEVPAGTYLIGTTIGGTGNTDLTVRLLSGATIKQAPTLANKLFQFNNATRVRLTGAGKSSRIDVSSAPNSGAGQANDAIYFAGTTSADCEVDNLYFYAGSDYTVGGGDSAVFGSCKRIKIHDNVFEGFVDEGVYLSGLGNGDTTVGNADVYDNLFLNCLNAGGAKRLFYGARWRNNRVIGGGNGFFSGEADTSNMPGVRNDYLGNYFEGLTGVAITSRISQMDLIEGNRGRNLTGTFISLEGTSSARVRNNTLLIDPAVFVSPSTQIGIVVQQRTFNGVSYNSSGNLIEGNLLSGVYTPFREADANQTANVFLGNIYSGHTNAPIIAGPKSYISDNQTRRLQGVASGFTGTEKTETQVAFHSTNGNTTNVFTLSLGSSRSARVQVSAVANTAGANSYGQRAIAQFRRASGGNILQVGSTELGTAQSDYSTSPSVNIVADTAANSIRVQITGIAGTTIDWVIDVTYVVVATNT